MTTLSGIDICSPRTTDGARRTITAIGLTKKTVENDIRKSKILDCYSNIDNPVKSTGMSIVHVINT